ncbi:DoxX family protein [Fictibacillus sp. Mic-4]|uniref:DoxX family membrane protein n=1 Tax=Fictibacillus TaxID=1329200 RepID=UPI0004224204|nr:DoxX family protein [Fictibacillus gelatini]
MFLSFLRTNLYCSYFLTVVRLYLGFQWLEAGWGKISGGSFDAAGFLKGALQNTSGDHPAVQPWWAEFVEHVALPNVAVFNMLVPWGEFLVGLGLILGTFTTFAALMGAVMNLAYLLSGAISTNPQMMVLEFLILVAGFNAARVGIDYWLIPFVRTKLTAGKKKSLLPKSA